MHPLHCWNCVLLVPFLSVDLFLFFPVFLKTELWLSGERWEPTFSDSWLTFMSDQ